MSLITAAHNPPLVFAPETTVLEVCRTMKERNIGSVAIVDADNYPVGILTERDVVHKVVAQQADPATTTLGQVMTSPCVVIPTDRTADDAIALMLKNQIHHLPLVDENRQLAGIISYRTLMRYRVETLNAEVDHLSAYMGDDGIGGD